MKRFAWVLLGLGLAACQTTQPNLIWVRADGRPVSPQQFELDKTICLGETQKSAVGMAPVYYHGIGGAIDAAILENQRGSALQDVGRGCMAQHGYLQRAVAAPAAYSGAGVRYNTPTPPAYGGGSGVQYNAPPGYN